MTHHPQSQRPSVELTPPAIPPPMGSNNVLFTISSNVSRMQEWCYLVRDDVSYLFRTPPSVSFLLVVGCNHSAFTLEMTAAVSDKTLDNSQDKMQLTPKSELTQMIHCYWSTNIFEHMWISWISVQEHFLISYKSKFLRPKAFIHSTAKKIHMYFQLLTFLWKRKIVETYNFKLPNTTIFKIGKFQETLTLKLPSMVIFKKEKIQEIFTLKLPKRAIFNPLAQNLIPLW